MQQRLPLGAGNKKYQCQSLRYQVVGEARPSFRKEKVSMLWLCAYRMVLGWNTSMLLFLPEILVMLWTKTSLFKESRTVNGSLLITAHAFLVSLTVLLCGQVGGWCSRRRARQGRLRSWAMDLQLARGPARITPSAPGLWLAGWRRLTETKAKKDTESNDKGRRADWEKEKCPVPLWIYNSRWQRPKAVLGLTTLRTRNGRCLGWKGTQNLKQRVSCHYVLTESRRSEPCL